MPPADERNSGAELSNTVRSLKVIIVHRLVYLRRACVAIRIDVMWPYVVFRQWSADKSRCAKSCTRMPERKSRNPDKV